MPDLLRKNKGQVVCFVPGGATCIGYLDRTSLFPKEGLSRPRVARARTRATRHRARFVALGPAPSSPSPDSDADSDVEPAQEIKNAADDPTTPEVPKESPADEVTADDILNSPSFLKKKLEIVQKELFEAKSVVEKADESLEEEKSKYVRLAADFENFRRRSADDMRKLGSKSTAKVCKQIIDVLDNFERANGAVVAETEREQTIQKSYQAIYKQLMDSLAKLNVEPVDAVGKPFDPELHEAIQQVKSTEHGEGIVCEQFRRGYAIGDTLIRASVVAVSQGPGPETPEKETADEAVDVNAAESSTENGTSEGDVGSADDTATKE